MSSSQSSFQDSLVTNVIDAGRCISCGTCVVVCPFACIELSEGRPTLVKECKTCGICARACPRYRWSMEKAERLIFGRARNPQEDFGINRRIIVAKTLDNKVSKVGQDGGVVTTLLISAMKDKLLDAAIVAGTAKEKPFYPIPKLATSEEEVIGAAGTKYSCSSNILGLTEALKQKKAKVAFVGTPCQVHAIRTMQIAGMRRYTNPLKFVIGLMCSECFSYDGLIVEHIQGKLGLNLSEIRKINIKGKMLLTTEKGVTSIPLAEIKQYARKSCSFCDDFSNELADISVGGLGLDGWTFTIIRTEKGEELFANAEKSGLIATKPSEEAAFSFNLLSKLSHRKRETAATS